MWGKPKEWLPWYRAHDYDGDLTEHEKRQLDGFRMQPKHPAADLDNLPEEVRTYIGQIEMGLYNQKQERVVSRAFGLSGVGAALLRHKGQRVSIGRLCTDAQN